jgi:hypothetical protein
MDEFVTLGDSMLQFGDIGGGAVVTSTTTAEITIESDTPDRHKALLDWVLTDSEGRTHTGVLAVRILRPTLRFYHYAFDDAGGDADGIPDPGESGMLRLWLHNSGLEDAKNVAAYLNTNDMMVGAAADPMLFGDIAAGEIAVAAYAATISPQCQVPYFVGFDLDVAAKDNVSESRSVGRHLRHAGISREGGIVLFGSGLF